MQLLSSCVLFAISVPSVSLMYMQARTAVLGKVVCEHLEPFHYCALQRDGLFELTFGAEGYGALCPATPQSQTLRHPYVVRPMIQWIPQTMGRKACWAVGFVRRGNATKPLTWQSDLRPASAVLHTCTRSTNDHIMLTPLDELAVEGDGTLYLSVRQQSSRNPVEVVGVFVDVTAVYQ